jgi:hypothetical protein
MAKDRDASQPASDIYTGLLAISLGAMITGCVFLYLDYSQYSSSKPPDLPKPSVTRAAPGQTPGR